MADYTSNLKSWGATGQEFPDNYSYIEDEAPVDDWDNFLTNNLISDVRSHLIPLTNSRIESDSGTTRPSSPEDGHVFYDSDAPVLEQYRAADSSWHALALDEDLDAHVADTTNPHSVTYAQANAIQDADATVTEAHLAFATATQSELDSHTSDTTNPHSVTYAQANAIQDATSTVDESHLSFDTATQTELDSHVTDTNNPHSVGLEQARTQNPTLSGNVGLGGNSLLDVNRADFNSGDVRIGHAARELLVEEYDGSAWTTRLSVDETGASIIGALSVSSSLTVTGSSTFESDASFGGNSALGLGTVQFSDADGDGNQWTATEDATSGNLEVRNAGTPVLDVGSSIIDVLGSLREGGDRVATRTWTNNNADVPNADYADSAGDADTVDGKHATDLGVTVEDGTTVVYDPATGVNFGNNLNVTDDGDGTVTVDSPASEDTHTGVSEDGTQTLASVDDIDFLGHLNVLDEGDGTVTVDPAHVHDDRYLKEAGDTLAGVLDMGTNDLVDGTTTVWDSANGVLPQAVQGGPAGSLSSYPLANADLSNSAVTVTAGNQLTGGGSVSLGGSITVDVDEGAGSGLDADTLDGNHAADLGVTVEDGGTVVYDPSTGINFGTGLAVTDDTDGTVTVDSAATLSELSIDANKDWGNYDISNVRKLSAEDGSVMGKTLESGDNLTVEADESMVVSEEYTVSGTLTVNGSMTVM